MEGKRQTQQQIMVSAYEMEVIQKSFNSALRWLELYIEKSGYSGNWQRQVTGSIERQDITQPSEVKSFMETALLALDGMIEDKPDFVLENLQEKFYSWLDKSGIRADNCPKELVECLINIHKVLTSDGQELVERVDREASEGIAKMTLEERRKNFHQTFAMAQGLMDDARARKKSLEGKTYRDVEMRNQFAGNHEQGREFFSQIESQQPASYGDMEEDISNSRRAMINNIKRNRNDWKIENVLTFSGHRWNGTGWVRYDREVSEIMLVHRSVAEKKYNEWGGLIVDSEKMLHRQRFSSQEWLEIERVVNRGQWGQVSSSSYYHQQKVDDSLTNTPNQDNDSGKGGIIAIVGIVSALLIASVVVVKKRLNKKVKKR